MKARMMFVTSALTLLVAPAALAQSAASNKAFFAKDTAGIVFAPVSGAGYSAPITLISVPAAVKTSSGGALSATLSMESLLSTYNLTTAIVVAQVQSDHAPVARTVSATRALVTPWARAASASSPRR